MTTAASDPQIVPRPPVSAGPARRRPGRGRLPWSRSSPTTPAASTAPSGGSLKAGTATWTCAPCRRSPSPWPATWRCAPVPMRRRRRHPAPGTSAIAKAHEWAGHDSPGRDRGVREALKGWGRRLARPQRQAGALTADVLAVIRLTAIQPRQRGRGIETPEQAAERARFDLALVAVLSDAGLRRSEAAALTWGDVVRWDDGSGRITVIRSKTDAEAQGAVVAITPAAMGALDVIRPAGVGGEVKVFGLSESQIARRVKVIAKAAGLAD